MFLQLAFAPYQITPISLTTGKMTAYLEAETSEQLLEKTPDGLSRQGALIYVERDRFESCSGVHYL